MRFERHKCVKMRLRPGSWGAYSASQTRSWIWGKGGERRGREGEGKQGRDGGEGKGRRMSNPEQNFWLWP